MRKEKGGDAKTKTKTKKIYVKAAATNIFHQFLWKYSINDKLHTDFEPQKKGNMCVCASLSQS